MHCRQPKLGNREHSETSCAEYLLAESSTATGEKRWNVATNKLVDAIRQASDLKDQKSLASARDELSFAQEMDAAESGWPKISWNWRAAT